MKSFSIIAKILTALAAIAGAIYVIATYGDKIVAWAKKLLSCSCCESEIIAEEDFAEEVAETVEEAPVEEVVEEAPVEEAAPAEEVVIEENAPVADEADFEG